MQTHLNHFKLLFEWLGRILAILGIAFVVTKLFQYGAQIHIGQLRPLHYGIVLGLSIAYACANNLLAMAWLQVLAHFNLAVPAQWAIKAYGVSQLSKYIPGNIFHIASRQVIGQLSQLPAKPLIQSSVYELILLALCGVLYATLTLHRFVVINNLASLLLFIVLSISAFLLVRLTFSQALAKATCLYWLFLASSGLIFVMLFHVFAAPAWTLDLTLLVLGGYILAWLAGLVTPGAPAGIGVREAVLWIILQGTIQQSDLLTIVVIGRIITSMGDVLFFTICTLAKSTHWRYVP